MKSLSAAILSAAILLLADSASAQESFFLKDGDRVLFYGDSITEVQFYDNVAEPRVYTTYLETYAITRFPNWRMTFVNSAWSGDTVYGGAGGPIDVRLSRDVVPYKPTVMTIMLGTNDAGGVAFDPKFFNRFVAGYEHILQVVQSAVPGIRITLLQPSPHDDVTQKAEFEGGYNEVLVRYGAYVKKRGDRLGLSVADMNAPLVNVLQKAKAIDTTIASQIIPDRTHPGPAGQLVMAATLLKAWHAPALVSDVEIDAARRSLVRAQNTAVKGLEFANGIAWTQTDKALPFPIDWRDAAISLAVRRSEVVEALDRQPLKVTSLTAARYRLAIDGEPIGVFYRQQLAAGVNLALLDTPMQKQALRVHALTLKRNDVHFGRWRRVQVPLQDESLPEKEAALDALDKLEQDVVDQQRATAQPKAHRFELLPE
jgi:lysophospholipase L1-like esterase